jgi:hypothetical protein
VCNTIHYINTLYSLGSKKTLDMFFLKSLILQTFPSNFIKSGVSIHFNKRGKYET